MGFFTLFRQKKAISEKKEEEVKKQQITKLTKSIYDQRIDFLKDKLERLKQKQQEFILTDQIEELEEDMADEPEDIVEEVTQGGDGTESLINNLVNMGTQALINRRGQNQSAPSTSSKSPPTGVRTYTDDEITLIVGNTPKDVIAQIKGLPDLALTNIIKNQYKDADDTTIAKAILKIREQP